MNESRWQTMKTRPYPRRVMPALFAVLVSLCLVGPALGGTTEPATKTADARYDETIATLRLDNYIEVVASILNAGAASDAVGTATSRPRQSTGQGQDTLRIARDSFPSRATSDDTPSIEQVLVMHSGESGTSEPDTSDPGKLATRAVATAREPLVVTTTVPLSASGGLTWPMPEGQVAIVAADGSRIELDASNGDSRTVEVTIVSAGQRHRLLQSWSIWTRLTADGTH